MDGKTLSGTEDIRAEIERLGPWFHNLHLPDGSLTAPDHFLGDFPNAMWRAIADHIPPDLEGCTVLDIGCNAGFYSFELARRGAEVTGIDSNANYLAQASWAAGMYGLRERITFERMQVYELAKWCRSFDFVLFLGVFYHLRYPLLALDIVARKVRKEMIFQTLTIPGEEVYPDTGDHEIDDRAHMLDPGWPKMAFIEHSFAHDPTNWWAPNHAGVEALLRSSGFRVITRPGNEIYICEPDKSFRPDRALWQEEYLSIVA
jgi:tRNA (mo5U34)-methyltransferase